MSAALKLIEPCSSLIVQPTNYTATRFNFFYAMAQSTFFPFVNGDIDFSFMHPRTIGLYKLNTYEMTKGILS